MTALSRSAIHRSIFLAPILAALGVMPAHGAITLLVDTNAKTFTWSGTATSDGFVVTDMIPKFIRLGMGTWNGGTVSEHGDGAISATLNTVSGSFTALLPGFNPGQLVMADSQNSLYTDLGSVMKTFNGGFPGDETATVSLTITGDGQTYSYASSLPGEQAFLESLDGTDLYFQDFQGGLGTFNIGSAAGQIVVVPEPSTVLLGLAAPLALLRRRRQANV